MNYFSLNPLLNKEHSHSLEQLSRVVYEKEDPSPNVSTGEQEGKNVPMQLVPVGQRCMHSAQFTVFNIIGPETMMSKNWAQKNIHSEAMSVADKFWE